MFPQNGEKAAGGYVEKIARVGDVWMAEEWQKKP